MTHMHYKGTGKVHSFRGLLASGEQRKIRIQGPVGAIAWRINKLEGFPNTPGVNDYESTIFVWREEQDSVSASSSIVDYDDDELLATLYDATSATTAYASRGLIVVFDNALFSRNIFVGHTNTNGANAYNYYIELEEVKVSAAGMAQLSVAAARRGYVPGT